METQSSEYNSGETSGQDSINAKRSVLIFFLYYIVQFLTGLIAGVIISVSFIFITGHRPDEQQFESFARSLDPYILITSSVFSAAFLYFFATAYSRGLLRNRTVYGFAFHGGTRFQIFTGFISGLLIAVIYAVAITNLFPPDPETKFGPVTEMAFSEGFSKYAWLVLALLFAPPVEEFLFRGVLFAGFTKSFGLFASALLTTLIFLIIHISEYLYYPPAMTGILALGILTVSLRIKTRALGPSVAAHLGYNLFIAIILMKSLQ